MAGRTHKLAIVVPYQDREWHLSELLPALDAFFKEHHPGLEFRVFVIEQEEDGRPFNRGLMKNIGFFIARRRGYDYCAFHDVDMLPVDDKCDYSYPDRPTRLASIFVKEVGGETTNAWNFFFGGVVLLNNEDFAAANGYSNEYWGWGAEDEDLRFRCTAAGLQILLKWGTYRTLKHASHRARDGDLPSTNRSRLGKVRAGEVDTSADGLSSLQYHVLQVADLPHGGLKVTVRV